MKLRLALQKVGPLMSPQPSDIFVVTDDCVVIIIIVIYKKIGQHREYFVTYTTGVYYRCPWVGLTHGLGWVVSGHTKLLDNSAAAQAIVTIAGALSQVSQGYRRLSNH